MPRLGVRAAVRIACAAATFAALAAPAQAAPGDIYTFAGTGVAGFGGDGGPAVSASLRQPMAVALADNGSVLLADFGNHRIRRISPRGEISTVAGTGAAGYSGDGGAATSAQLSWPIDVEATADGGFLIADYGNKRIRRVSPAGVITTVVGTGQGGSQGDGGPASSARVTAPAGVAVTPDGGFLVADAQAGRVRRVFPDGTIATVAGGGSGGAGDGGSALAAQLSAPIGVAALPDGGFVVAEWAAHRVRRVSAAGVITRVAGTGIAGFSGDGGAAAAAQLNTPVGVSATSDGGFLIGDSLNGRVRKVFADGTIATIAGTSSRGYAGDGGPAALAELRSPAAAVEAPGGAIIIADNEDNRLRLIEGLPFADGPARPPGGELPGSDAAPRRTVSATARRVLLPVTCPPTATQGCTGTIRLFVRTKPGTAAASARILFARGRFSVAAGERKVVRVRLTRAGRRLLRKRREVTVRAVVARRGGPNIGQSSEQSTLRVRRKRRRASSAGSGA